MKKSRIAFALALGLIGCVNRSDHAKRESRAREFGEGLGVVTAIACSHQANGCASAGDSSCSVVIGSVGAIVILDCDNDSCTARDSSKIGTVER